LTSRCVALALPLFSAAIGIDLYLSSAPFAGDGAAVAIGATVALGALAMWFGRQFFANGEGLKMKTEPAAIQRSIPLKDKIKQTLTEARVVLPGAQALLGFSCITTMTAGFAGLPSL